MPFDNTQSSIYNSQISLANTKPFQLDDITKVDTPHRSQNLYLPTPTLLDKVPLTLTDAILVSSAANHPYLDALESGELPDLQGAIRDYVFQYQHYSRSFVKYLDAVIANLDPEDQQVLLENKEEEMGMVNPDDIEAAGIKLEWVKGIRHTELFRRFKKAILPDDYQNEPIPIVLEWEKKMLHACVSDRDTGLGCLGLATEFIVSTVYQKSWAGIQKAFPKLDPKDSCFFPLHISCDDGKTFSLLSLILAIQ